MEVFALLLPMAVLTLINSVASKLSSRMVERADFSATLIVLLLTAVFACIFFGFMAKFQLAVNMVTLFYSLMYALIVVVSMICSMKILKYASISAVNVISRAGSLVATAATGALLFGEKISVKMVLRIILMLIAVFFVFADKKRQSQQTASTLKNSPFTFGVLITFSVLAATALPIVNKYFTMEPDACSENIYYFYTNVIMFFGVLAVVILRCMKNPVALKSALNTLKPKYVLVVLGNSVVSGINSILSIMLIAMIHISWYTAITSAMSIILSAVASLLFKERLSIYSYIAVAICLVVVFI